MDGPGTPRAYGVRWTPVVDHSLPDPMKAVSGGLPTDDTGWAFEVKWDGVRVVAGVDGPARTVRLRTANGLDATARFPEVAAVALAVAPHRAVLDGEVVAFDEAGRPSFERLARRTHLASAADARGLAAEVAVTYVVFDVLSVDDVDLTPRPYVERRRALATLLAAGPGDAWVVPEHRVGDGEAFLAATRAAGLEGVMAKRLDSRYEPGRRSSAWRKVKNRRRQEFVVGGWVEGAAGWAGSIGALLVGVFADGALRYCGRVGSGLSSGLQGALARLLAARHLDRCPFEPLPPAAATAGVRWARPEVVVEVAFAEWTGAGLLRHPSLLGIRDDKDAASVVREPG